MREVRARLAATQVEYISGKVFFTTCSDLNMLKKLKSAERLFLLITKRLPFTVSSPSKGKILSEMQRLVNDDPGSWLEAVSHWKSLLEHDAKKDRPAEGGANPRKRKVEDEVIVAKKSKVEEMQVLEENHGAWEPEKHAEGPQKQRGSITRTESPQEKGFHSGGEKVGDLTFRVSCRCSGAVGKAFPAQEVGRVLGIALMKQFGWQADLRNPGLEIFMHLNDIYSVVGIPMFRVPLASRTYIRTAGLRSTIAWAMASLAEIKAGAFVLDPMCGLGTILLEAANEWPDVYYVGADVSKSQLHGAYDNLKAASLTDKIELLQVSVVELPLPSESVDIIISDIPFGKKFKLGNDIKIILQEMERVLCVDGTIVLLLSEDHHRRLGGCRDVAPLNCKGSHSTDPEVKTLLSAEDKVGTSETMSSAHGASNQEDLYQVSPFGSLVPVECFRVSLGKTDAFICKYKKAGAPQPPGAGCHEPGTHPETAGT
uniref:THUMP domain-containing protein 2 isoform X2 n=1 Tax=Jaculus jaculus TaxID=51337 RepID=UPI001E1B0F5D|nr:THUMP domain-containing protein 2 isoform X2 [Jaculus jaculus]